MKRYILVLVSMFLLFVVSASLVMAAKGKVNWTNPPENKLTFQFADGDVPALIDVASINVLFDPPGLSESEGRAAEGSPWKHHDIQGLDAPTLEFTSGEPYRLEMDLFFDGYEDKKDVREWTDKIEKLAVVNQELHRPPTDLATPACLVTWGSETYTCEVETVETKFTLFQNAETARAAGDEGTPVRAVMHIVFSTLKVKGGKGILSGSPSHPH